MTKELQLKIATAAFNHVMLGKLIAGQSICEEPGFDDCVCPIVAAAGRNAEGDYREIYLSCTALGLDIKVAEKFISAFDSYFIKDLTAAYDCSTAVFIPDEANLMFALHLAFQAVELD